MEVKPEFECYEDDHDAHLLADAIPSPVESYVYILRRLDVEDLYENRLGLGTARKRHYTSTAFPTYQIAYLQFIKEGDAEIERYCRECLRGCPDAARYYLHTSMYGPEHDVLNWDEIYNARDVLLLSALAGKYVKPTVKWFIDILPFWT